MTFRLTDPDGRELGCWSVPRLDALFRYFVACRELPVSIWQRLDAQMRLAPTASTWDACGYTLRRLE